MLTRDYEKNEEETWLAPMKSLNELMSVLQVKEGLGII